MAADAFDVVVIGSVGIDSNIYIGGDGPDFTVESNFTENIDYIGQAGGYACRTYARLGKKTAFLGYLGDDYFGKHIRQSFTREGIDMNAVFIDPLGTKRSINLMYPDGHRKNFYDGKGHLHLNPDLEERRSILSASKLAHFNIPNWARQLLPVTREMGLTIAVDLQDVVTPDDPYRQDFIRLADILFFSAVNYDDPQLLIDAFHKRNSELIVVSGMGADGCALGTQSSIQYFPAVPLELPIIDTNGAGDSLAAAFLSSYVLEGYSLEQSLLRGQIAARYACSLKASSADLITSQQLEDYYQTISSQC